MTAKLIPIDDTDRLLLRDPEVAGAEMWAADHALRGSLAWVAERYPGIVAFGAVILGEVKGVLLIAPSADGPLFPRRLSALDWHSSGSWEPELWPPFSRNETVDEFVNGVIVGVRLLLLLHDLMQAGIEYDTALCLAFDKGIGEHLSALPIFEIVVLFAWRRQIGCKDGQPHVAPIVLRVVVTDLLLGQRIANVVAFHHFLTHRCAFRL
jgi:hypothetical protein